MQCWSTLAHIMRWSCLHFHRGPLQSHRGSWQTSANKGRQLSTHKMAGGTWPATLVWWVPAFSSGANGWNTQNTCRYFGTHLCEGGRVETPQHTTGQAGDQYTAKYTAYRAASRAKLHLLSLDEAAAHTRSDPPSCPIVAVHGTRAHKRCHPWMQHSMHNCTQVQLILKSRINVKYGTFVLAAILHSHCVIW